VAVSAVILTALYATFFSVFRAADASEAALDRKIEAGRTLDRLARDVRSAYFEPGSEETRFLAVRKDGQMELGMAVFTRSAPEASMGDMAGVRYYVGPGSEDEEGLSLYRESWDLFMEERARVELIGDIDGFGLEFFDGREWSGAWDSTLNGGPPKAVRIEVALGDGVTMSAMARVMID